MRSGNIFIVDKVTLAMQFLRSCSLGKSLELKAVDNVKQDIVHHEINPLKDRHILIVFSTLTASNSLGARSCTDVLPRFGSKDADSDVPIWSEFEPSLEITSVANPSFMRTLGWWIIVCCKLVAALPTNQYLLNACEHEVMENRVFFSLLLLLVLKRVGKRAEYQQDT